MTVSLGIPPREGTGKDGCSPEEPGGCVGEGRITDGIESPQMPGGRREMRDVNGFVI